MTDRASVCCQVTIGAAIASLLVLSTIGILLADTSAWRSAGADLSPGTGQRQVGADKWSSGAASSDSGWMLAGELPTSSAPADGELFGADSDEALDAETTIARHDAPRPAQANGSGTLEDEASSSTNKTGKVNYMAMLGKRRSKRRVLATECKYLSRVGARSGRGAILKSIASIKTMRVGLFELRTANTKADGRSQFAWARAATSLASSASSASNGLRIIARGGAACKLAASNCDRRLPTADWQDERKRNGRLIVTSKSVGALC